jgi:hypothetical protein
MDKLPYPYIRRKRRSLIIEESVPDGPPKPPIPTKTEPVQPVVKAPEVESADKPKDDDAKTKSISPSKTS